MLQAQIEPDSLGCLANGRNAQKVCGRSVLAVALALVTVVRGRHPPSPTSYMVCSRLYARTLWQPSIFHPPKWLPNTPMIIVEGVYFSFPLHPTQKAETGPPLF